MDNKNLQITNHDFLIYRDSNNDIKVGVMLINNDIWLTQNLIAELFGVGRSTITEHINNILNSGELDENNTVGKTDIDNSILLKCASFKFINCSFVLSIFSDTGYTGVRTQ